LEAPLGLGLVEREWHQPKATKETADPGLLTANTAGTSILRRSLPRRAHAAGR
jgi:hypothetical protein